MPISWYCGFGAQEKLGRRSSFWPTPPALCVHFAHGMDKPDAPEELFVAAAAGADFEIAYAGLSGAAVEVDGLGHLIAGEMRLYHRL